MPEYDAEALRVSLKVVYYGPALSGKTTSLLRLHERLSPERRGDLVTLDTYQDRTLFFDLLPFFMVAPSGLKVKVKVYTVPGQVRYDATRKAVLSRADGVVFVADSLASQQRNNAESFANLEENCRLLGMDVNAVPLVVQFNKRDLPEIVSEAEVRSRWEQAGVPIRLSTALTGQGVVETFLEVVRLSYGACDRTLQLKAEHGLTEDMFIDQLGFTDA